MRKHITDDIYKVLASDIISSTDLGCFSWEYTDDEGYTYYADINLDGYFEETYTGVEFMGDRECYLEPVINRIEGSLEAYDVDGNDIETDFDVNNIYKWIKN